MSGLLELELAIRGDGRTGVISRRQRFPLRMTVPMYLDAVVPQLPFIYVQNPAGGVFPGDDLVISLDVAADACVHLTTQSATKVYAGSGPGARQQTRIALAPGAYAEVIPDTLIPYAGASVEQDLLVELGKGASLVASELLAPGRHHRGERFRYDRVRLATTVREANGRELCVDVLEFQPAQRSPLARGLLGAEAYLGTLMIVAPHLDVEQLAVAIDAELAAVSHCRGGAGMLPSTAGVGVRVIAERPAEARRALDMAWAFARHKLLGAPLPPRRK